MDKLIKKLAVEGGCIVSSADCSEMEIADARARGDFWVDNHNYGYVRRLPEWLQRHSRFARNASPDCCERDAAQAALAQAQRDGLTMERRIALWDAINAYVVTCGGNPSQHITTSRMNAVAAVERVFGRRGPQPAERGEGE